MAPKAQKSPKDQKKGKKKAKQPLLVAEEEEPMNMESMGHPEIYPLVLTTKTQEIFNCRAEEDFTDEQTYKLIKKEDILADLLNRAAVSDFHPVKKIVREYPGDELLLVYDKDFKYGLNFYLIGTEEGKENFLKTPEVPEEQEEPKEHAPEDMYIYKPPVSKPWVSLGSEKEIEEESIKESKRRVTYMISRKRSQFGAPVAFRDQNASSVKDAYIECASYVDKNYTLTQAEKDIGLQVIPEVKGTSTQTRWPFPRNATTQYYPREFSEEEKESLEQSKSLVDFLKNVSTSVEIALQQNEIMNTFINDWKNLAEEESTFGDKSDTHLKEYQSFTDLHSTMEKMITCVSWHPTIYGLIVVSVAVRLSYEERVHFSGKLLLQPSLILFWSFSDPIHPQLMLESPDDIFCFEFCPSDPNIIAGGCINGQIVLWDITAHADRIENIKTGGSRSKKATLKINRMGSVFENRSGINCQLVTCSADCTICFWDIRPLKPTSTAATNAAATTTATATTNNNTNSQQPVAEKKKEETIEIPFDVPSTFLHLDLSWKPLSRKDKMLNQIRALKAAEINPYHNLEAGLTNMLKPIDDFCTKFFVGTEEGEVIYTDWKMERDSETGRFMPKKPVNLYTVHDGAVHTVQRSPFYNDIILTIGGWNVAIWKEEVMTCCAPKRYTAGHWSLTRPGVFYIGREDGYVDIWDLLEKTHEPAQSQNICITMITYIKPWTFSMFCHRKTVVRAVSQKHVYTARSFSSCCVGSAKQQFIAIADYYGTLHILEIPWTLSHPSFNEVSSVNYYFEREVRHLEYVQQRKLIRDQEKKEMALELVKKKTKIYSKSKEHLEAELKLEYESYVELEKAVLFSLGLGKVSEDHTWR
ncbi:hypothetical protein ACRRTK_022562 [Alexandromys fortis]